METYNKKQKYCGHCKQYISLPVFKRHKTNFYDKITQEWRGNEVFQFDEARDAADDSIINSSERDLI